VNYLNLFDSKLHYGVMFKMAKIAKKGGGDGMCRSNGVPGWVHPRPHKHITTTATGQGEENGLWHVRGPVKMDTWSPKWVGLLDMAQG
jgi:hypothetical protein